MATRFGMGIPDLQRLLGTPRADAEALLASMKAEAKRRFQDLALELHPDHNPDDAEAGRKLSLAVEVRDYILGLRIGPERRPGDPDPAESYQRRQDAWVKRAREQRQRDREARVRDANVHAARDSKIHAPTAAETASYGTPEDTPREEPSPDTQRVRDIFRHTMRYGTDFGVGIGFSIPFMTDDI